MISTISPYRFHRKTQWLEITKTLIQGFPIPTDALIDMSHYAFEDVFRTRVGSSNVPLASVDLSGGTRGGIIGGFFEYLFINKLIEDTTGPPQWRFGSQNNEPDMVYIPDPFYSLELKTSSQRNSIWGSSSKVHKTARLTKDGSGFYLVVNYEFKAKPELTLLRFGWLDDTDWQGSKSAASASSKVIREHANLKLLTIYEKD